MIGNLLTSDRARRFSLHFCFLLSRSSWLGCVSFAQVSVTVPFFFFFCFVFFLVNTLSIALA